MLIDSYYRSLTLTLPDYQTITTSLKEERYMGRRGLPAKI